MSELIDGRELALQSAVEEFVQAATPEVLRDIISTMSMNLAKEITGEVSDELALHAFHKVSSLVLLAHEDYGTLH